MASTTCYNRGCGKSYNPRDNPDNSCQYHPGAPFFHDAYKGWTCCNKKSTDFTMFLSFPGCTQGQHSNVKPEEPESITGQVGESNNIELPQVNEVRPNRESLESVIRLQRPGFNKATLTRMKPTVAPALIEAAKDLGPYQASVSSTEVAIGEQCKNSGCKGVGTFSLNLYLQRLQLNFSFIRVIKETRVSLVNVNIIPVSPFSTKA